MSERPPQLKDHEAEATGEPDLYGLKDKVKDMFRKNGTPVKKPGEKASLGGGIGRGRVSFEVTRLGGERLTVSTPIPGEDGKQAGRKIHEVLYTGEGEPKISTHVSVPGERNPRIETRSDGDFITPDFAVNPDWQRDPEAAGALRQEVSVAVESALNAPPTPIPQGAGQIALMGPR